jgi:hypothetical protein
MASLILRSRLFLSSYAPLFLILAIRFRDPILQLVMGALTFVGVAALLLVMRKAKEIDPDPHLVLTVADRGAEVAGYVATYLLPFVTVEEPTVRDLAGYVLFFIVVGVVYVRSDMVQINPLLYLTRYRVWAITTSDGWAGYLVSRNKPRPQAVLLASRLANTLAVERDG